jgi:hypothetical protein
MTSELIPEQIGDGDLGSAVHALSTVQPLSPPVKPIGAVVVGGDFQGLGIVRSLGRHGVPISESV